MSKEVMRAIAKALEGIAVQDMTQAEKRIYNVLLQCGYIMPDNYDVCQLVIN